MLRPLAKHIDLAALTNNYDYVSKVCAGSRVMVVVKSDAYGHGLLRIAKCLTQADGFAVACLSEAVALRRSGITQKVLVLQGCYAESEMESAQEYGLSLVCHTWEQLEWLKRSKGKGVDVWVKFDTGMNRLGFPVESHAEVMQPILNLPALQEPPVVMSHFACADSPDREYTNHQLKNFENIRKSYQRQDISISLANSAAALRWQDVRQDWVRTGIAIYGCLPVNVDAKHAPHLSPVMSVEAPIIAIKQVKKGARIGYDGGYVCKKATRLGIVAMGYGDGYPRHARVGTPAWIDGCCYPLIGKVSMDMIEVDLGDADVQIGDYVELWGKNLSVSEVASFCDTIPYELLCSVSATGSTLA